MPRECFVAIPDALISGKQVVRELTDLMAMRGKPSMIVIGNWTDLTSNAMYELCNVVRNVRHYTAPDMPTQNAIVEISNEQLLDKLCNLTLSNSLDHADERLPPGDHYNTRWLHWSLGYAPPERFAAQLK